MILIWTYFRALFGVVFVITWTALMALFIVLFGALKKTDRVNQFIYYWVAAPLWLMGVEVKAFGTENLPRKSGALFVFNHQSHFDILAFHRVADITVRFGAKIELFKIPFFGHGMRAAGALPIVRENRKEVFKVYKESESRIAHGESFILAPEGTRQPTAHIGTFKKGPFIFAVNAKAPIIPTVIVGSFEVMSKKHLLPNIGRLKRTIEVHFLKPVPTLGRENDIAALVEQVRTEMSVVYEARHKILYPSAED